MQFRKLALVLTAGAAIAAFFAFDLGQYLNLRTLKEQQAAIQAFQAAQPLLSIVIYFLVYVVATALSVPGAALLTPNWPSRAWIPASTDALLRST